MYPILFKIGNFPIHSYGVMMVVAFFAGIAIAVKRAPKFGLTKDQINDMALGMVICGILGARITFIVQELPYYLHHLNELFSLQFEGLTSYGGLIFGMGYLIFYAKRKHLSVTAVLDSLAPGFLVGHAIGRVGCLLNGCCYGPATTAPFPWGVHFVGTFGNHEPAQVYDLLMTLAGCGLLLLVERRGWRNGQAYSAALAVYGISRFIYEFWRAGVTSAYLAGTSITEAQAVAILLTVVGVAGFVFYARKASHREAVA